jgi:beta-lactamase regulating signal transducer with metallopeptidase domain
VNALLAGVVSNAITAFVLACVVWIVFKTQVLRRRPAERYLLALVLLVKFVSPPLFGISIPGFPELTASDVESSAIDRFSPIAQASDSTVGLHHPDISRELAASVHDFLVAQAPVAQTASDDTRAFSVHAIAMVLCGGSLLGTTLIWLKLLWQWRRVRQVLRLSSPATESMATMLAEVCDRMGCRQVPHLCVARGRIPPMLWAGSRRPWIVLPSSLISRMHGESVRLVLAHEVAHFLRRDHWANLFVVIVTSLFWWHPAAWWARREIRESQELCCDAFVLSRFERSRRCYAATMFETLEFLLAGKAALPSLASGFGEIHSLHRRFTMLADPKLTHLRTWRSWIYIFAAMSVLPLSVLAAQQEPVSKPVIDLGLGVVVRQNEGGEVVLSSIRPTTPVQDGHPGGAVDPAAETGRSRVIYATEMKLAETAWEAFQLQCADLTGRVGDTKLSEMSWEAFQRQVAPAIAADSQHLKNTLLVLDKHYWDAGSKGDGREIEKMLADEFVSISVLGRYGKRDAVEASARYRLSDVAIHDPEVIRIGQNNAVVTYAYDCKIISASGAHLESRKDCRVTFVWEQRGGGWVIVFCHDNHGARMESAEYEFRRWDRDTGGPVGTSSRQNGEKQIYQRQIEEAKYLKRLTAPEVWRGGQQVPRKEE